MLDKMPLEVSLEYRECILQYPNLHFRLISILPEKSFQTLLQIGQQYSDQAMRRHVLKSLFSGMGVSVILAAELPIS